jgi:hypothetical protein
LEIIFGINLEKSRYKRKLNLLWNFGFNDQGYYGQWFIGIEITYFVDISHL